MLTFEERVILAKKEYKNYEIGQRIFVGNNLIGYVSEVNHSKSTGEDSESDLN